MNAFGLRRILFYLKIRQMDADVHADGGDDPWLQIDSASLSGLEQLRNQIKHA